MTPVRQSTVHRLASQRGVQRLLAVDMFLLLCALSLAAITAQGPATRALGRSAAILVEIDTYLDNHLAAIQQQATEAQDAQLSLPDYALPVSFSPEVVRNSDRDQFRSLLLARSGALLREHGAAAFRTGAASGPSLVSPRGSVSAFIDFLRPRPHQALAVATAVLAVLAALLALRVAGLARGFDRLSRIGRAVLVGSGAFIAFAITVRIGLALAGRATSDYTAHEFLSLIGDLAWAPVRDGAILSVVGAVMLAVGDLLARSDAGTLDIRTSTQ